MALVPFENKGTNIGYSFSDCLLWRNFNREFARERMKNDILILSWYTDFIFIYLFEELYQLIYFYFIYVCLFYLENWSNSAAGKLYSPFFYICTFKPSLFGMRSKGIYIKFIFCVFAIGNIVTVSALAFYYFLASTSQLMHPRYSTGKIASNNADWLNYWTLLRIQFSILLIDLKLINHTHVNVNINNFNL